MRDNQKFHAKCDKLPTPSQSHEKFSQKNNRKKHTFTIYMRRMKPKVDLLPFLLPFHSESNWININIYLSSSDCCLHFAPTIVSASLKFRASLFPRRSTHKVWAPFATLACPQDSQISALAKFLQIKVKAFRWPLRNPAISRQAVPNERPK